MMFHDEFCITWERYSIHSLVELPDTISQMNNLIIRMNAMLFALNVCEGIKYIY